MAVVANRYEYILERFLRTLAKPHALFANCIPSKDGNDSNLLAIPAPVAPWQYGFIASLWLQSTIAHSSTLHHSPEYKRTTNAAALEALLAD